MMKYLQRIGRSLMLPVAVLPAAALLLGIGYWIDPQGWGGGSPLAAFLIKSGASILDNMPILFAVGVALGMSKNKDGSAALAGLVGFLVVTTVLSSGSVQLLTKSEADVAFSKINNQFIGILSGLVASVCYNKFYDLKLPEFLAFFSGKRSVPIITSVAMLFTSGILFYAWPLIYQLLLGFGTKIMLMGSVGAGIYGFLNRLLIPFGLHHTLNSIFWFDIAGINDIVRFLGKPELAYANVPDAIKATYTVGMYQAGFFPMMMFGLPAAGYAMYIMAKEKNKKVILSLMVAAGFTSFLTGVTEPLEFAFMFAAPMLYFAHAVLTGIIVGITAYLKYTAGFAFSAGLIDFALSLKNANARSPFMLIIIGIFAAIVYFVVFVGLIKAFNLKSPGRSDEEIDTTEVDDILGKNDTKNKYYEMAKVIYEALGKKENILNIDNCTTRLRLEVKDTKLVDIPKIKKTGAKEVIILDENSLQIIVGPSVQFVADEMNKMK